MASTYLVEENRPGANPYTDSLGFRYGPGAAQPQQSVGAIRGGDFMVQPAIAGYRKLSHAEADLMNEIKAKGVDLGNLVAKLRGIPGLDLRWVNIGATDLQTGIMALVRAVAQPTTF